MNLIKFESDTIIKTFRIFAAELIKFTFMEEHKELLKKVGYEIVSGPDILHYFSVRLEPVE